VDDIDAAIARLQQQILDLEKRKQQYVDLHPKME
jgi:MFS transporter, MHS family, proline/betaine transporter